MFSDNQSKRIDVVLEFYRQTCLNMRMFVDLRFKHFTTFMVITGFLGAAAFNVPALAAWRPVTTLLAIVVTVLFWLIDARTLQYWRQEFGRVQVYERALNEGVLLVLPPPERTRLRSSTATNLLFAVIVAAWTVSLIAHFLGQHQTTALAPPLPAPQPTSVASSVSVSTSASILPKPDPASASMRP